MESYTYFFFYKTKTANLVINPNACDGSREPKFNAIPIALRKRKGLHGIQIGGHQHPATVVANGQHEFADALRSRIVVVDAIPDANVTVGSGRDNVTVTTRKSNIYYKE